MDPEFFIQGEEGDVHPEEKNKGQRDWKQIFTCIPMNMEPVTSKDCIFFKEL